MWMPFTPRYSQTTQVALKSLEWNILFLGSWWGFHYSLTWFEGEGAGGIRWFKQWVLIVCFGKMSHNAMIILFRTWKQTLPTYIIKKRHACKPRAVPLRPALAILTLFQLTASFRWLSKTSLAVKAESYLLFLVCLVKSAKLFTWNRTSTTWLKLIVSKNLASTWKSQRKHRNSEHSQGKHVLIEGQMSLELG
jgi:hypothetical protein